MFGEQFLKQQDILQFLLQSIANNIATPRKKKSFASEATSTVNFLSGCPDYKIWFAIP